MKITTLSLFFIFSFYNIAQAYIDPGTTSMLLQGLIAIIAGGVAYITLYWNKFKNYIKKLKNSSNDKGKED